MKTSRLLVLIALTMPMTAVADESSTTTIPAIDTSLWKCKYCVVEEGWNGDIELGLGYVSQDSYKFGEYTGLKEKEGFFVGNANLYYRSPEAYFLDLSISDLGIDSRSLNITGGQQGFYKIFLNYDEIPHFISNSGASPYLGNGSTTLTLPAWVTSGSTAGMTNLTGSLQKVNIGTERKRLNTGLVYSTDTPWSYTINYRNDSKQGSKRIAGAVFFNSAQLIQPVDYDTDEMTASISYDTKKLQANFAYYSSVFSNSNKALSWDNAYTPFVAGADSGQLALPPDNQFHQFLVSAGYDLNEKNHISGDIAIGRMEQNDSLLAATQNTTLGTTLSTAGGTSNAEADTVDAKLRLISTPTDKLRLTATIAYNERDNKTPQSVYNWVTSDSFVATPRKNLPYSTKNNTVKLNAKYRLTKKTKIAAGYDMESRERTFQDTDKTTEKTLWGTVRTRTIDKFFIELKLATSQRDASTYSAVADIVPAQNSLMRKYNLADRDRNTISLHTNITPEPHYTIGLNLDMAENDYERSQLGLRDSSEFSLSGDISAMLDEKTNLTVFMGLERIKSTQAGSQTFSTATWLASNDDTFENVGISISHSLLEDELDIGVDYVRTDSTGAIAISTATTALPKLETDRESIKLYANYQLQEMLSLRLDYWHEHYQSKDWSIDGVLSNTIPNVLAIAELSPVYDNNVIKLSMAYRF